MKKSPDSPASEVKSTSERLGQLVDHFYRLPPTEKEQDEICKALLGKLENHFKDFFESCVAVKEGYVFGYPGIVFDVRMPKGTSGSKGLDFNGFVSYNRPNHPIYWDDEESDIYKTIYTISEIEELIRAIRQCKRELGFYVDEDCSDLFESQEAKNLVGIIRKGFGDEEGQEIHSLWVKNENGDITSIRVGDSGFYAGHRRMGLGSGDPSCLFAHNSNVNNDDKMD